MTPERAEQAKVVATGAAFTGTFAAVGAFHDPLALVLAVLFAAYTVAAWWFWRSMERRR